MKKSQKGVTLVEIIVAIAVFSIISLALFSSVISMKTVVARQEEYVRLEMVCYDISAYYEANKSDSSFINDSTWYLNAEFSNTTEESAAYKIEFNSLAKTISIYSVDNSTALVENVELPIEQEADE